MRYLDDERLKALEAFDEELFNYVTDLRKERAEAVALRRRERAQEVEERDRLNKELVALEGRYHNALCVLAVVLGLNVCVAICVGIALW